MAQAAELGADHLERPLLVGGHDHLAVDIRRVALGDRHQVALQPLFLDPERMQHVERGQVELELAVDRHVKLVRGQFLGVFERPLELLRRTSTGIRLSAFASMSSSTIHE